jgi:predicted Zn-dependent protease
MFANERFEERDNWGRASMARRLADAALGGPHEKLMSGFQVIYASQSRSSEFETREERIVLPDRALELFEETALAAPPTAHVRALWEDLARVMLGKRAVNEMYKYLQPLATKYAPWPVLEQILAQADLEALEPRAAARRLSALIASRARDKIDSESLAGDGPSATELLRARQMDLELWFWLGDAQRQAGDHADAVKSWRRALDLQPENRALRREFAMELVRAGDPEGRKLVDEILSEKPGDAELATFQGPGPYPDSPTGSVTSQMKPRAKKSKGN